MTSLNKRPVLKSLHFPHIYTCLKECIYPYLLLRLKKIIYFLFFKMNKALIGIDPLFLNDVKILIKDISRLVPMKYDQVGKINTF